ncbi:unnamed protein product, partial [Iphiclides podalirius]
MAASVASRRRLSSGRGNFLRDLEMLHSLSSRPDTGYATDATDISPQRKRPRFADTSRDIRTAQIVKRARTSRSRIACGQTSFVLLTPRMLARPLHF